MKLDREVTQVTASGLSYFGELSEKRVNVNWHNTLQTTDGTQSTVVAIEVPTDTVIGIKATVTCRKSAGVGSGSIGDGGFFMRRALVKNVSGTVTLTKVTSPETIRDVNQWKVTIDVTGTTFRIRVTGTGSDNLDWKSNIEMFEVD